MRHVVVVLTALLTLTACASAGPPRTGAVAGARVLRHPPLNLVGTWRGTAFGVPGSLYLISTPVELTINPDGTWSWSKRGAQQASGRCGCR